ncbi:hypothetical protein BpJC7_14130 [Weizmannia acidilactici]|uniref:Uncharacterized protein n=2 Tax=Bacillaceae TaxID=186817 RepID=A0A5J4JHT6_9BACI|nr:hypothetical protein BpJC4_13280 [Weizmannia acidilactici]GER70110.1 hypothetical protein BpJC7_14130 [Weizmannia acidilactici]GER74135.1 hypothetical protein BpPP18_22020 [Weizmannia acidilactici]
MTPEEVIRVCTKKSEARMDSGKPKNWLAGAVILMILGLPPVWSAGEIFDRIRFILSLMIANFETSAR